MDYTGTGHQVLHDAHDIRGYLAFSASAMIMARLSVPFAPQPRRQAL